MLSAHITLQPGNVVQVTGDRIPPTITVHGSLRAAKLHARRVEKALREEGGVEVTVDLTNPVESVAPVTVRELLECGLDARAVPSIRERVAGLVQRALADTELDENTASWVRDLGGVALMGDNERALVLGLILAELPAEILALPLEARETDTVDA